MSNLSTKYVLVLIEFHSRVLFFLIFVSIQTTKQYLLLLPLFSLQLKSRLRMIKVSSLITLFYVSIEFHLIHIQKSIVFEKKMVRFVCKLNKLFHFKVFKVLLICQMMATTQPVRAQQFRKFLNAEISNA